MLYDPAHARTKGTWSAGRHIANGVVWVLFTPVLIASFAGLLVMDGVKAAAALLLCKVKL